MPGNVNAFYGILGFVSQVSDACYILRYFTATAEVYKFPELYSQPPGTTFDKILKPKKCKNDDDDEEEKQNYVQKKSRNSGDFGVRRYNYVSPKRGIP